jgi:hypothetical protein
MGGRAGFQGVRKADAEVNKVGIYLANGAGSKSFLLLFFKKKSFLPFFTPP